MLQQTLLENVMNTDINPSFVLTTVLVFILDKSLKKYFLYSNDKFMDLDKQVWANGVDPDQTTSSLIRVYTGCYSVCIFWMHYSMENAH